ncbi:MAG: hypothetical protein EA406_04335 [Rhodospirillales bacterium]|nr:MAG: hypothetical protein EA406_04335 [Rhodospirillales bacterium]
MVKFRSGPRWRRTLLIMCLIPLLGGCYLPRTFQAEVVLSRTGFYGIAFDGEVAWVPLLQAVRAGELGADEEHARARLIVNDLRRDSATQDVRYVGDGSFALRWVRSGDARTAGLVSFIRRSERFLTVTHRPTDGVIVLSGRGLAPEQAAALHRAGLRLAGEIRVWTDGPAIRHNAQQVRQTGPMEWVYRWSVRSPLDPPPHLVMATN